MTDTERLLTEILTELCEEMEGTRDETLRLWSVGKCIGGPTAEIGPCTPRTCLAILEWRHRSRKSPPEEGGDSGR